MPSTREKGGTFLSVSEMRKTLHLTHPAAAQHAPPTLHKRPRPEKMASAMLCRPGAAPAAVSGPVPSAITAISGISGPDQVDRGGPRGLRCRSCDTPPHWAAIPRSQLQARALRAAPPLSGPRFPQTGFFEVVDSLRLRPLVALPQTLYLKIQRNVTPNLRSFLT